MSNFVFLKAEWPDLFQAAAKAEALACPDARGSRFYARRALDLAVHWLYKHDAVLNQIEFVNLTIHHLTERGFMDPALLYASPYTDFSPKGVEGVFSSRQVDEMVSIPDDIRKHAAAAY